MAVDTKVYLKKYGKPTLKFDRRSYGSYPDINNEDKNIRNEIIKNFSLIDNNIKHFGFDGRIGYLFHFGDDISPLRKIKEQEEYNSKVFIRKAGCIHCLTSRNKKDSLSDLEQFLLDKGFKEEKH